MASILRAQNPFFIPGIAISASLLLLALLFVGLRSYVRLRILGKWGIEDWMCCMQLLLFAVYDVTIVGSIYNGGGMNIEDLADEDISLILFWSWLSSISHTAATMLIKATIIFMYLKIFASTRLTRSRFVMVAALIVNTCFYFAAMVATIFRCGPVWCVWTNDQTGCKCPLSWFRFTYVNKVWNSTTDFAILALPALFISKLHASRQQKSRIIMIFTLAVLSYPFFGVLGLAFQKAWGSSDNFTREVLRVYLIFEANICTGIICCCIPVLRLYRKLFKHDPEGGPRRSQQNRPRTARHGVIDRPRRVRDNESDTMFIENEFAEIGAASELTSTHSRAPIASLATRTPPSWNEPWADARKHSGGNRKTVDSNVSTEDSPAQTFGASRGQA